MLAMIVGLGSIVLLGVACYCEGRAHGQAESRGLVKALEMEIQRARGTAVLRACVDKRARRVYPQG